MNAINEAAMVIMVSLMTQFGADNKIKINPQELWCLSQNIYMEARAESYSGKQAVANVTRNRVKSTDHPNTYCAVVKEGPVRESWKTKKDPSIPQSERVYIPLKHRCQFSWWCDGEKDTIWVQYMNGTPIESNMNAWRDSVHIALDTISNHLYDNTQGATYYYAHNIVYPHWAKVYEITEVIGNHTFMRRQDK
jgi:spore germination cell wall hydrolase CwlJ-like protein